MLIVVDEFRDGFHSSSRTRGRDGPPPPNVSVGGQPLRYAMDQLAAFCRQSAQIEVRTSMEWTNSQGLAVLVGRSQAERYAPVVCKDIRWEDLGTEGFVLRTSNRGDAMLVIAAGATDVGTRHAVYALMCELDISRLPRTHFRISTAADFESPFNYLTFKFKPSARSQNGCGDVDG